MFRPRSGHAVLEEHGKHSFIVDLAQFVAWMKIGLAFLNLTYGELHVGRLVSAGGA